MKRVWIIIAVVLLFLGSFAARKAWFTHDPVENKKPVSEDYQRIVALAPSTVEVVYALGQGDKVVGVSEFTRYPADAAAKPKVGGYINLDMEALLRLKPDVVLLLDAQVDLEKKLQKLGISTLRVNHMTVEGILESIVSIGDLLNVSERGLEVNRALEARIETVKKRAATLKKNPEVLVSIGREGGLGRIKKLVAAGANGYHQELITMAAGSNGYQGKVAFPSLTREHLLRMNPDVIIDLFAQKEFEATGEKKLLEDWQVMPQLKAVHDGKVYVLGEDVHFIPGPRFIETLELFQNLILSEDE